MTERRWAATQIVELFEDLLDKHEIVIPDEDRDGHEGACIYGYTYFNLVDEVEVLLDTYGMPEGKEV